ncbi:hypothetical protein [Methanoregula sp.]|uniref:hypothetical protein n=1 Tax=Methanoregula sp. TaxID=2052170 RepID=UPI003567C6B5
MSFIISLYVQEGIVMASDSRLTLTHTEQRGNQQVQISVPQSDANYKTFLAPGNIGISTYGAADIQGVPISGYIDSFITEKFSGPAVDVNAVPKLLIDYFRSLPLVPDTGFHVAGYSKKNGKLIPHLWRLILINGTWTEINKPGDQGAAWEGENDVMTRLIQPVSLMGPDGSATPLPPSVINWQFFTLQDAIDFAIYAVKTTRDTMRFQTRLKTVGGPIDVLVIKPDRAFWVQRKELHAEDNVLSF